MGDRLKGFSTKMCGIAGVGGRRSGAVAEGRLEAMASALGHRGPDSSAVYSAQGVGLAHTRLRILDLSDAGAQPWVDEGKALSFNGEIYNFRELRRELEGRGLRFSSTSDTEVLFRSLVTWGVAETLRRIRGMFAFAYADVARGETFLCRDRLGIKPLAYLQAPEEVLFASEVKAIAAVHHVEPDPLRALYSVAGAADHSSRRTLFRGVAQVPPGSYVRITDGRAEAPVHYYRIQDEVDEGLYRQLERSGEQAALEQFDETLRRSVAAMKASDAPLGLFLSGGVDSSLIAALAEEAPETSIGLFTSDVVGPYSEAGSARLVASHLGATLEKTSFFPDDLVRDLALCTYHYEAPIITHANAVPFAGVARLAASHGIKPVLTGEGSDELFIGYPPLLADRYRRLLTAPIRGVEWPYRQNDALAGYLFDRIDAETKTFLKETVTGFEDAGRAQLNRDAFGFLTATERETQVRTLEMLDDHLTSLLHRNDRMGMLAGIESRFPFLDEDVVHLGVNMPLRWKVNRSLRPHNKKHPFLVDKWIVRRVAERYLPRSIAMKVKEGFPMSGLRDLSVKPGSFADGWVFSLLDLDSRAEQTMLATQPRYQVAKLFSVEVFGRLFGLGQSVDDVAGWATEHASIVSP